MIQTLVNDGHRISLLCFHDEERLSTPLDAICEAVITVPTPHRSIRDRLKQLLLTRAPDIATRLYSDAFWERLKGELNHGTYDAVQFEGIEVACYLPLARTLGGRTKLIFDTFNAEAHLQYVMYTIDRLQPRRWLQAFYSWVQSERIARYEGDLCRLADAVIAVSPEDADVLQRYQPQKPVFVVPSGIIFDDYAREIHALPLGDNALVFTGKMDYRPNVDAMLWFIQRIFPQLPNTRLVIVGQQPHSSLQALENPPTITLTGWVDSVQPYLKGGAVYIAPLRMGSGTRLKLLEAMATGCAIVATTIAGAGLLPEVKNAMMIADDETAIKDAILYLLRHPQERQALGERAREQVKAHYDWSALLSRLAQVYKELGIG